MKIQLSEHFTYKKLLQFVFPSIIMMIFTSIYSVVDGLFVSNFVGKSAFAAVNLIMPFLMGISALGFMIGTGGSAIVAKTLGEGKIENANEYFSMLVYITAIGGIIIATLSMFLVKPVAILFGASGTLLDNCILYGRILCISLPAFMLQNVFQSFFVTAEKPQLGLAVTVAAGVTNIALDALLVAVFPLGLSGAAAATALSQCVGGIVPLIYFFRPNPGRLRLGRAKYDGKALLKTCTNGSSELMSNISMSVVSMLYNVQLMKYAGEDGVAAYGVLMYVNMIFLAAFIGYSVGTAPVIGYHYGAGNHEELKSLLKKSLTLIGIVSVVMLIAAELLAKPLAMVFVGYDEGLLAL